MFGLCIQVTNHRIASGSLSQKSHNVYHWGPGRVMQSESYKGVRNSLVRDLVVGADVCFIILL